MTQLAEYNTDNRIAYITINRPEKRNALNPELVGALTDYFLKAGRDDDVKVVVLRARGKVFSAGADLEYLQKLQNNSPEDDLDDTIAIKELLYSIYTLPKLVIAQVEGHAIAGGCGLAAVCDIVFAVPEAKFGYTEVKIGFVPALVACFLVRRLGEGRVRELLLSGELIDAATASSYGLINFIADKSEIAAQVRGYAERLVAGVSGQSVALTKQLIHNVQNLSLEASLDEAIRLNVQTRSSSDCKKGITSFLEKNKLEW
ncbi:enoyl-CoA hydratase/isomerase family protein [Daejeonella sp.]|uniref:enoyl-CoA hydratase/isomerase family protein n=1 Tax=Daejeonella sp. TaxID=2805397 RepID=UPI003983ACDB